MHPHASPILSPTLHFLLCLIFSPLKLLKVILSTDLLIVLNMLTYTYIHTHTHDLAHHHRRFITLPPPPPTDTNIHLYGHAPPPFQWKSPHWILMTFVQRNERTNCATITVRLSN